MRIELGYPDPAHERALLAQVDRRELLARTRAAMDGATLMELQQVAGRVHVAEPLLDYVQKLVAATRARADLRLGLSPRAAQGPGARRARLGAASMGVTPCCPMTCRRCGRRWPSIVWNREPLPPSAAPGQREQLLAAILKSVPVPR